ncbi:helix-turn-helix domain-containing protein [Alistipes indistinctus]|jgi:CRISPR/Cas system CSM-associated protein Csm2 small subunit|uniref:helix-turn-helix domain-containing protein n=1 Tax=Alistipes indistinctus TaxID=626932 RepID=UPI00352112C6
MDLVKLYQQIKESCQSIDQKMDLLREDIRKLSNAENSPASKLEDTVLDYLDVAQVLHISTRQLRRLHNSGELVGFKAGRRRYYFVTEVQAYLRKLRSNEQF